MLVNIENLRTNSKISETVTEQICYYLDLLSIKFMNSFDSSPASKRSPTFDRQSAATHVRWRMYIRSRTPGEDETWLTRSGTQT